MDTLKHVKRLEGVGFARKQAETQVQIMADFMNNHLASKQDVQALQVATHRDLNDHRLVVLKDLNEFKGELRADLEAFKTDMRREMNEFKTEIRTDITRLDRSILALQNEIRSAQQEITIRLGRMLMAGFGLIAALLIALITMN